ncbi:MAG TPA: MauE/DoxX family redox-associated membrane protein, partial [Gaiellaceae bacterium]|nr:MauE/DoxX family redox-associated membrane protein [Gaiellaceae bacterium]
MRLLGLAIRLAAAAIWLFAGIAKLFDLEHFRSQVAAYDLLPHALVGPFAYGLPFVETLIGLYLLIGLLVRPAAIVTCALMTAFLIAQSQAWARGLSLDCGCFGTVSQQKVGLWSIVRDGLLGIPGLLLAIRPARYLSLDARYL